ncbi:MAG TPA: hypothetical protein VH280_20065 [Verrucomicrobiae bacterium]|jgi:hypothetical protein|nr:hypothetical protein [Verrucomicrobiae bacterium]
MELGLGVMGVGRSAVLTAAGAIFIFVSSSYSQNLVQNGSFDANGGSFQGWQIGHSGPGPYSGPNVVSPGFGGNPYYARFTYEQNGNDTLSQDIATIVGAVYRISFSAEDGAGHNFGAEFNFGSFSDNLLSAFAIGPGQWYSGWTNFTFDVTASQLETDLSFNIAADMGSEFGLDNVSVVELPVCQGVAVGRSFHVTVFCPAYPTLLQASTNMVNWVCVCTNMPPYTFTDSFSQFPRRFYRAIVKRQP